MPYSHLSLNDRYVIHHLCLYGLSCREIGRRLKRHHSTIAREIARNGRAGRVRRGDAITASYTPM